MDCCFEAASENDSQVFAPVGGARNHHPPPSSSTQITSFPCLFGPHHIVPGAPCENLLIRHRKDPLKALPPLNTTLSSIITARVRSTREDTVFTGVCLSTSSGGGYLPSGQGGTYLRRGYLPSPVGGYIPWQGGTSLGRGYLP